MAEILTWLWADLWGASGTFAQGLAWCVALDLISISVVTATLMMPPRPYRGR